ncbi:GlcG/HbpS family heme-binding protein [Methylobacterium sp. CM6257]
MTPYSVPVLALCLALISAPALAQSTEPPKPAGPPQAPAGGTPEKIPFGLPYGAPVTYEQAKTILAAAEAEAKKRGWPMNIAVVDTHGELVHFARLDGAQLASIRISQNKARTAARWRRESRVFFNFYAAGSNYYGTLDPDLAASPGGIPLVADGKVIGAIGCSGGTGDQDALICQMGADALK